ncbi:MAG: hypothetical protein LR015_09140 [Verrucomicrobia bacterium]|nr:hypothetical protein [Verrucomicrobiota bacterium]
MKNEEQKSDCCAAVNEGGKEFTAVNELPQSKSGFIGRMFAKLDNVLKQKAEQKAASDCCCGDGKGGKC